MWGQAFSMMNKALAGRITGTPWERTVRKGAIIKLSDPQEIIGETRYNSIYNIYAENTGIRGLKKAVEREKESLNSMFFPAQGFKRNYEKLFFNDEIFSNAMFFMYNPTTWSRSTRSGIAQINIPGNKPRFHQADIPPQKFSFQLMFDASLWNNTDGSLLASAVEGAIGLFPTIRELQTYHTASAIEGGAEDPFETGLASLAPVINWYERLCRPDKKTKRIPELFVAYQDWMVRCYCETCDVEIQKSDWRMNITRCMLNLGFCVLENKNLEDDVVYSTLYQRQLGDLSDGSIRGVPVPGSA